MTAERPASTSLDLDAEADASRGYARVYLDDCPACFAEKHQGHDVGWRHKDGRLYSATCHDCMEVFDRG